MSILPPVLPCKEDIPLSWSYSITNLNLTVIGKTTTLLLAIFAGMAVGLTVAALTGLSATWKASGTIAQPVDGQESIGRWRIINPRFLLPLLLGLSPKSLLLSLPCCHRFPVSVTAPSSPGTLKPTRNHRTHAPITHNNTDAAAKTPRRSYLTRVL
jgi:hypothetical protein